MPITKYSRQRESIRNYLAHTKDHPTADMVYMQIRKLHPNISLGTVYRNLNLLVEQGEALKLSAGSGGDHFDGNVNPHLHFVCTNCGRVLDLDIPPEGMQKMQEIAEVNFTGEIKGYFGMYYGTCPACKDNA